MNNPAKGCSWNYFPEKEMASSLDE